MALASYFNVSLDFLASPQGANSQHPASATNEKEAILLGAYRSLPPKEADSILQMLLARLESRNS